MIFLAKLTLRRFHCQVDIHILSVLTDAENGECVADVDLLLQEIQKRSVILTEKIFCGQFGNLQSYAVLDCGIREKQEFDRDLGDHVGMSSVVAGDAQRVADFCAHTIKISVKRKYSRIKGSIFEKSIPTIR